MKVSIQNLGVIRQAEFSLGDLTIICGRNNTGKTYVTHATFGFLEYVRQNPVFCIDKKSIELLFDKGTITVSLSEYIENIQKYLDDAAKKYTGLLNQVFAGNEGRFKDSSFRLELEKLDKIKHIIPSDFQENVGSAKKSVLHICSSQDKNSLEISLVGDKENDDFPSRFIENTINNSIGTIILGKLLPQTFLASAERTGAAIFQKELDFTKNRLVEMLGDKSTKIHSFQFLSKFSGDYPLAVRKNVDFIRDLPNLKNKESFLAKYHSNLLTSFRDIIGGDYKVNNDGEIQFVPTNGKNIKLSLVESSSAVRSLLDVGFYLYHIAKEGDILMVDEPELNLHPENQRRVARLFTSLVNIGIKVFITTHSDYIIKELNTLILLNQKDKRLKELAKRENYKETELLDYKKVKVYIAEEALQTIEGKQGKSKCQTLVPADINETGIEVRCFDVTIEEMNRIQEEIIWGGNDNAN
jgi:predicted ATP-dependent endonuclease of OLD family